MFWPQSLRSATDQGSCSVTGVQGKYEEAAAAYERVGAVEQAMEMWTDLRQFDKASQWAERAGQGSASVDALRAQQALWSEEVKDLSLIHISEPTRPY